MALLGIKIPASLAKTLKTVDVPGKKEDTSDLHISILVFENEMAVSDISKSVEAVCEAIKNTEPFKIKLAKVSCFPKREDNPVPIIMPIESEDLQKLHKKIKKAFKKHKIEFMSTFKDYKPHVTLSYNENEVNDFKVEPEEFLVDNIVLWSGDMGLNEKDIFITFPLEKKTKKTSSVIHKVDFFHKMASRYLP